MRKTGEEMINMSLPDVVRQCVDTILAAGDDAFTATLMDARMAGMVISLFVDVDPKEMAELTAPGASPLVLMLQYQDGNGMNVSWRQIDMVLEEFRMMQLYARFIADKHGHKQVQWKIYSSDTSIAALFEKAVEQNRGAYKVEH